MYNKIVGLAGLAGAGKSTIAAALADKIPSILLPFAGPLKDLATSIGWDGRKDIKGRKLLQLLGTDVCRNCISEDYWLDKWLEDYKHAPVGDLVIADDIRFQNEADLIASLGGRVFNVQGRSYPDTSPHASENGVFTKHYLTNVVFEDIGKAVETLCRLT